MRVRSFRLRLALLAVLAAATPLVLFVAASYGLLVHLASSRVNHQLIDQLVPQLHHPRPPEHWERFDGAVRLVEQDHVALQITDAVGRPLFSRGWPDGALAQVPRPGPPEVLPAGPPPNRRADGPRALGGRPPGRPLPLSRPVFRILQTPAGRWRCLVMSNGLVTAAMALDLRRIDAEAAAGARLFVLVLLPALAVVAVGSWLVAGSALRPVRRLAQQIEAITAHSLDQRLATSGVDSELVVLWQHFNALLDRLHGSFAQARRFSADAAHELQTPLTVLQGSLEQALQAAPDESAEQQRYADLLDEVQRLRSIVRKLLLLSRADAGQLNPAREPVDLQAVVRAAAEDASLLADDLRISVEAAPLQVLGDPDLLRQAVANLTSNAVKYNRRGGQVELVLRPMDQEAWLEVTNTGPGIPGDRQEQVFERFWRADPARSRQVGGAGLGLALVREIARAHGGDVRVVSGHPQHTTFRLTLPRG
ncbi:MAG: HAMP domain-containing protein [Fimbriimonadaceae bacterium]|nr:HAMP domain-containing protein [Fimbriimonadaceae bacterium]